MSVANPNRTRLYDGNMCNSCGVGQGAREWCEYCGGDTTPSKPLSDTLAPSEPAKAQEPTYNLPGLSQADLETLIEGLYALNERTRSKATVNRISILLDQLDKLPPNL